MIGEPTPNPAGIVLLALTLIGVAVTVSHKLYDGSDDGFAEVVERSSDFAVKDVERCLESAKGGQVLESYFEEYAGRGSISSSVSIYISKDGSRILFSREAGKTKVSIKSVEPLSPEELDVIEWCVEKPSTTWIPPENR